jgi:hypothetical protein
VRASLPEAEAKDIRDKAVALAEWIAVLDCATDVIAADDTGLASLTCILVTFPVQKPCRCGALWKIEVGTNGSYHRDGKHPKASTL